MKGRPEYISREDFRGGRSPSQLNKLFVVDNILPSSYIMRDEQRCTYENLSWDRGSVPRH